MSKFVPLPGSQRKLLPNSRPAGPAARSEIINLTVRVRSVGNPGELEHLVREESNTPLAERRYLSREELAARFGGDPIDLNTVENYAAQHNLVVVRRSSAERSIVLQGALGDMLHAFPAHVATYHHRTGTYRGRTGEIQIPQELEGTVTSILGFDTRPKTRHSMSRRISAAAGPGGQNGETGEFFAQRYRFPEQIGGAPLDGSGQAIGIIELGGGFQMSDLSAYFAKIGSPMPNVSFVSVDGASNNPGINEQLDGEVMLDIEVIGAVVPRAKVVVYFAPNNGDQGFVDAISAAVYDTERKIDVISISWGGAEPDPSEVSLLQPYNDLFKAAAAVGITVCVASGDQGALGTVSSGAGAQVHVDHPACDPYVLACGGTEIDPSDRDVAWNDGFDGNGVLWATGGGISQCYGVPSYQGNVNLPEALDGGSPGRGVPDIAMSATDYFVRVDTAEVVSGGTSAVAPLMASLVTRLNQAKQKSVGFLNPFLYANAAAGVVSDVTAGSNGVAGQAPGYDARPGWDPCTGLGTPNGAAILNAL